MVQIIAHLASLTSAEFQINRTRLAVYQQSQRETEKIEILRLAASEIGIQVTPVRMALADAVWMAHRMLPLVARVESE